jgi:CPA1 family monovalent cation:H+ antiporter
VTVISACCSAPSIGVDRLPTNCEQLTFKRGGGNRFGRETKWHEMASVFDLFAVLLVLVAGFGWLNLTYLHLPSNIGLLLMGVLSSAILLLLNIVFPDAGLVADVGGTLEKIDFYDVLMHGVLGFLLFAGAIHVDWKRLKRRLGSVAMLATVGVLISTLAVGFGFWGLAQLFGFDITLAWALVFGALISPTDPVAVLSLLKSVQVPQLLETEMAGESLLNDGVGVVLFTILLALAANGEGHLSFASAAGLFLLEALGGAVIGLLAGYIAVYAMRVIDEYVVEVFISLALVTATYALADRLHTSGPIAVVTAGLLIGERGPVDAMSETTQRYLFSFWELIDGILNSVLFLLIGLELIVVGIDLRFGWIALSVIPLIIVARVLAIAIPFGILSFYVRFIKGSIPVLVWGGVRGGISIALALSIPYGAERPIILTATYAVVLFTVIVQGLTMKSVIRLTVPSAKVPP